MRRRLETESLLKSLSAEALANKDYIDEQQSLLDENSVTLEGLRQKAEMIERQQPKEAGVTADARKLLGDVSIHDDEVEIAFLAEKKRRAAS